MIRYFAAVLSLAVAMAPAMHADVLTSSATSTATYNGYYAWGSGASWVWVPGGSDAHYYSDCYPCGFWDNNRVYLEVGLPSITGNVTSAMLYVNVTGFSDYPSPGVGSASFYHQANSLMLTGNAYNDRGSLNAGEHIQNLENPGIGWLGIPVTSYVANDYANGSSYSTFAFTPTGNGYGNSYFGFAGPGTDGPYLKVTTDAVSGVPEPATISLLALAGAGLVAIRRRRS